MPIKLIKFFFFFGNIANIKTIPEVKSFLRHYIQLISIIVCYFYK